MYNWYIPVEMHSPIFSCPMNLNREAHTVYAVLGYCHKIVSAHILIVFISYGSTMLKSVLSSLLGYK